MNEETFQSIAAQLRQPHGEYAIEVGQKMNEGNLHINLNTIEALRLTANDNVLELGMGNGFFVKNILSVDHSIHYTGCDFSEVMVNEAIKCNENFIQAGRAVFHFANASQLPFTGVTFNKIFTINTLYFWEDVNAVLAGIKKVLQSGGELFISIRPKYVMEHYPFTKYGFSMFSKDELKDLVTANGFHKAEIIEMDEPSQEINGEMLIVKTLIVRAENL
ncbi:MAG: class I SAM-dependent methyltransferase [Bacteroidia bacterium]